MSFLCLPSTSIPPGKLSVGSFSTNFSHISVAPRLNVRISKCCLLQRTGGVLSPLAISYMTFDSNGGGTIIVAITYLNLNKSIVSRTQTTVVRTANVRHSTVFVGSARARANPRTEHIISALYTPRVTRRCHGHSRLCVRFLVHHVTSTTIVTVRSLTPTALSITQARTGHVSFNHHCLVGSNGVHAGPNILGPSVIGPINATSRRTRLLHVSHRNGGTVTIVGFRARPSIINNRGVSTS